MYKTQDLRVERHVVKIKRVALVRYAWRFRGNLRRPAEDPHRHRCITCHPTINNNTHISLHILHHSAPRTPPIAMIPRAVTGGPATTPGGTLGPLALALGYLIIMNCHAPPAVPIPPRYSELKRRIRPPFNWNDLQWLKCDLNGALRGAPGTAVDVVREVKRTCVCVFCRLKVRMKSHKEEGKEKGGKGNERKA
jgi:hypothetical protein